MLAIYKRELKSYFRSFIGFLFIAVTLFFLGLYFSVYNLMNGYPYFAYVVSSVTFFIHADHADPDHAYSGGGKAEQDGSADPDGTGVRRRHRYGKIPGSVNYICHSCSDHLLLPADHGAVRQCSHGRGLPVDPGISPLRDDRHCHRSVPVFRDREPGHRSSTYFLVLFLGYMMDSICSIISSTGNLLTKLLRCFDLYTPFSNLLNGTLDVSSIVYYVSVTALVLFLTVQSIQKRRYSMSVKNLSFSAYSTGMIAVAVALVVVVNIIMGEMLPAGQRST